MSVGSSFGTVQLDDMVDTFYLLENITFASIL